VVVNSLDIFQQSRQRQG